MNSENAIEIRNMSKSFKVQYDHAKTLKDLLVSHHRGKTERHLVLDNISLDIKKGETVGLIGTNGSGKSTLLKLMTKIIYPTSGTVETNGKLTSLLELGAGFHPDFTGRENIYFNAAIFGLTEEEIDKRVDDIIAFSELGEAIDEPIRTYSSGMYMRLAFSVAINVDADILLIDEILAVGDQNFQNKCYAKLRELRDSDRTIVIVSHSLDVVKHLCNRVIWIYNTHVQMDGEPGPVIDAYLKQISLDARERRKKEIAAGTFRYSGGVYIDKPVDFLHFDSSSKPIHFKGWNLSDCENGRFELKIGNEIYKNLKRESREDVYEAYRGQYEDFMDKDTLGWYADISAEELIKGMNAGNEVIVTASQYDDKGNVLADKNVILIYDEEK